MRLVLDIGVPAKDGDEAGTVFHGEEAMRLINELPAEAVAGIVIIQGMLQTVSDAITQLQQLGIDIGVVIEQDDYQLVDYSEGDSDANASDGGDTAK